MGSGVAAMVAELVLKVMNGTTAAASNMPERVESKQQGFDWITVVDGCAPLLYFFFFCWSALRGWIRAAGQVWAACNCN